MTTIVSEIKDNLRRVQVYDGVRITPTIAKELLEMNTDNRSLSPVVVEHYSNQMKSGKWKFSGENIKISRTGRLLDTQHRLHAIIQSNTTQVFNIQTGLQDDVFDVLDVGKNRTGGDALSIKGFENHNVLFGAIRLVLTYQRKHMGKTQRLTKTKRVTPRDAVEWTETSNIELMKECVQSSGRWYSKARIFAPVSYAAFCYLFSQRNKDMAFDFMEKLSTGENLTAESPIYILRQKLINTKASNKAVGYDERYAWMIKAWNAVREGTVIKRIHWGDDEDFPRIK